MGIFMRKFGTKIMIALVLAIPLIVSCSNPGITSAVSVPTQTRTATPEPFLTQIPTCTLTPTLTPSTTPTKTPTPSTTQTPTMTHFPTLDYVVNYPFNPHFISYTPIETLQFLILSDFILFIGQEYEYYATYEIPPNNELNGFPSANIWLPIIWDRLAIPAFCRYYPYAKLLHDDEKLLEENNYSYSLDFTFLEAQTLVGVDCADVDISMFPVPKHTPFPWNIK
jgi:hypothetical protein